MYPNAADRISRKLLHGQRRRTLQAAVMVLQGLFVCAVVLAMVFPHIHVVYPSSHDASRCALYQVVLSGAVLLAALSVFLLALRPLRTIDSLHLAPARRRISTPSRPRAPPVRRVV